MRGLFLREIPVEIVDLSLSGCLLRSKEDVPSGSHGELHIRIDGKEYRDAVYVVRSSARAGAGRAHDVGGEFLWGSRPNGDTVRNRTRSIIPH